MQINTHDKWNNTFWRDLKSYPKIFKITKTLLARKKKLT